MRFLPPRLGLAMLVLVWQIIAAKNSNFPTSMVTWEAALTLFANSFYNNGPNDQGGIEGAIEAARRHRQSAVDGTEGLAVG